MTIKLKAVSQHRQVLMELISRQIGLLKHINRLIINRINLVVREVEPLRSLIEMVELRANLKAVRKKHTEGINKETTNFKILQITIKSLLLCSLHPRQHHAPT